MEPQDYAIVHFEGMARLARGLKALPALILEHTYYGQSFGSWQILLKHKGRAARVTFDGKEDCLSVAYSSDRKAPYSFEREREVEVIGGIQHLDDAVIEQIISDIVKGP